jgi:hypothetical protein
VFSGDTGEKLTWYTLLGPNQLYDRADPQATIDYRAVLSEVLKVRLKNNRLGLVFPVYSSHQPLEPVRG